MNPSTIELLPIENKRVLIRVDFKVPLTAKHELSDDNRIRVGPPTTRYAKREPRSISLNPDAALKNHSRHTRDGKW